MTEAERLAALQEDYLALCHAMQTGVAFVIPHERQETEAKNLRVGVNSAMVEHGALVELLIRKSVITELEYFQALVAKMREEVDSYERRLSQITGRKIKLA